MNLKKFGIFTGIIVLIVLVTSIVLSCVKVNNGLCLDAPSQIIIYKKSTSAYKTYSLENTPKDYKKVNGLYEDITNISIFNYMASGNSLTTKPGQDLDENYSTWSSLNKSNNYVLEVHYKEKQSIVIEHEGASKIVEFYGLIFVVSNSRKVEEVALYFSTSDSETKSYSKSPILIKAKTNKLYKYIESLPE